MSRADREKWQARYRARDPDRVRPPSGLLQRWVDRIPVGRALDAACGMGSNALLLAAKGFAVDAVDISTEALDRARRRAQAQQLSVNWIEHDLDQPLTVVRPYALILIIRYVNLELIEELTGHLTPGGYLLCEQHLDTDVDVVGPSSARFRVRPGALPKLARALRVLHSEEKITTDPGGKRVALARLVAQNPG